MYSVTYLVGPPPGSSAGHAGQTSPSSTSRFRSSSGAHPPHGGAATPPPTSPSSPTCRSQPSSFSHRPPGGADRRPTGPRRKRLAPERSCWVSPHGGASGRRSSRWRKKRVWRRRFSRSPRGDAAVEATWSRWQESASDAIRRPRQQQKRRCSRVIGRLLRPTTQ